MDFDKRASWRHQQPFHDPPNQPRPQDGVYRQSQQPNREYDTYNSSSNSQERRTNIPNNQRQQGAGQVNLVINKVDTKSFESTLILRKINEHDTTMLVDSRSVANITDYNFFKEIRTKENRIESSSMELLGANSSQLVVAGATTMPVEMICRWTPLTSQHRPENDHKRQCICQIRHEKVRVVCPVFQICLFYSS